MLPLKRIGTVHSVTEKLFRLDPDPQLFQSFARKTGLDRFFRFTLPAREFPIAAKAVVKMALSDQKLSVLVNDRTTHLKRFHHFITKQAARAKDLRIVSRKIVFRIMEQPS